MKWTVTAMLVAIVLWLLGSAFLRPRRFYELPFLAGVMTFTFILPQLPGILNDPFVPETDYVRTIAIAISCVLMMKLGWESTRRPFPFFRQTFDEARLLQVAAVLSLAGAFFYYRLSHLPGELVVGVQMTGMPVIYLFFARLMTYGLAIAFLCFARRPSLAASAIIGLDLLLYLERIVVTGKRAETVELALIIMLAFWFHRGTLIPRWAVVLGLAAGLFTMTSMADYRQITRANDGPVAQQISQIDLVGNFRTLLEEGGSEMRNAIHRTTATSRDMRFDYGKVHWNNLVFNFVPAQLVGVSLKQSLMFDLPPPARDYAPLTGTTETGMADAFQSFWYFGALEFFLLAYVVARIWAAALEGWTSAQIAYMLSVVPATHAISHVTDWVLQVWVHMALFLTPALLYALVPRSEAGAPPSAAADDLPTALAAR